MFQIYGGPLCAASEYYPIHLNPWSYISQSSKLDLMFEKALKLTEKCRSEDLRGGAFSIRRAHHHVSNQI